VSETAQYLTGTQKSDVPTIIVNRCSGRVVSTNEAAEKLFRTSQKSLVGQEFGQLKSRLASVSCGRKMKMTNISKGNLNLTIITILRPETTS
jgi:nitrogen-specific signal transduction histidine kinase